MQAPLPSWRGNKRRAIDEASIGPRQNKLHGKLLRALQERQFERAAILAVRGRLRFDLPEIRGTEPVGLSPQPPPQDERPLTEEGRRSRARAEIEAALRLSGGKVFGPGGAAVLLGLKPTTLRSRMAVLGIERP